MRFAWRCLPTGGEVAHGAMPWNGAETYAKWLPKFRPRPSAMSFPVPSFSPLPSAFQPHEMQPDLSRDLVFASIFLRILGFHRTSRGSPRTFV